MMARSLSGQRMHLQHFVVGDGARPLATMVRANCVVRATLSVWICEPVEDGGLLTEGNHHIPKHKYHGYKA